MLIFILEKDQSVIDALTTNLSHRGRPRELILGAYLHEYYRERLRDFLLVTYVPERVSFLELALLVTRAGLSS